MRRLLGTAIVLATGTAWGQSPGGTTASAKGANIAGSAVSTKLTPVEKPSFVAKASKAVLHVPFKAGDFKDEKGNPLTEASKIKLKNGKERTVADALKILNSLEKEANAAGTSLRGKLDARKDNGRLFQLSLDKAQYEKDKLRASSVTQLSAADLARRDRVLAVSKSLRPQASGVRIVPVIADIAAAVEDKKKQPPKNQCSPDCADVFSCLIVCNLVASALANEGKDASKVCCAGKPVAPKSTGCPGGKVGDPNSETLTKTWGDSWGSSKFSAGVNFGYSLKGSKNGVELKGWGKATGKLFGSSFDLVNAEAKFKADKGKQATAGLKVTVLGKDISPGSIPAGLHFADTIKKSVNPHVDVPVATVLGIGIWATVGVKGEAGIEYDVDISPLYVHGSVGPYVSTSGYVEASIGGEVDLGIVSAELKGGVGGEMTFLKDKFTISANLWIEKKDCKAKFRYSYEGFNSLRALSGHLYVFAKAEGCFLGACVGDKWEWDIFEWGGIGPINTTLFSGGN